MILTTRKTIIILFLTILGIAAFLGIRSYIISNIGTTINKKLQSLKVSGFNVRYDSLSIQWFRNVVEIEHLLLEKNPYDTACVYPEFIAVDKVRAEGFHLFPLIFRNILSFESLYLDGSRIVMRQNSLLTMDSTSQRENEFTLSVDRVFIGSADFTYTDSVHCKMITGFKSNLTIEGLKMDFHVDQPFGYQAERLIMDSAEIKLPLECYTLQVRQAKIDFLNEEIQADSIEVIPDLGKIEFGRKWGYEIDRFEGKIPFVKAKGFSFSTLDSTRFTARVAEIQFYLKIFRDKRLPFLKKTKLLPMAQLEDLPFGLAIDSLKITKSFVQYEEFVEGAPDPGGIYFDDLYGVFLNINNMNRKQNTQLIARGSLMGQGKINIFVTFPAEKNKRSLLAGKIKDFSLPKINSMLTPSTNIKVESGEMRELSFNFSFNAVRSDGEIGLNYEDLKLTTFKEVDKSKGDELEKDNLKSFMMNTFIFRKKMDEKVPEEKRTGQVMHIRDDSRSIFNFWIKSVVSGIKSAYNLDKMEAKKSEREEKKEDRLSRRESRKLKKEEKKKERG
ncbi:MAG: hypothetical protein WD824_05300 [Cyclobacteriaceae bacterium]